MNGCQSHVRSFLFVWGTPGGTLNEFLFRNLSPSRPSSGVLTSSVQKDWSNVAQFFPDPGFLRVIPWSSRSSGSSDLGSLGFVLLCFSLLCLALLCLCSASLCCAVLCLAIKLI